eukprot:gene444-228_t
MIRDPFEEEQRAVALNRLAKYRNAANDATLSMALTKEPFSAGMNKTRRLLLDSGQDPLGWPRNRNDSITIISYNRRNLYRDAKTKHLIFFFLFRLIGSNNLVLLIIPTAYGWGVRACLNKGIEGEKKKQINIPEWPSGIIWRIYIYIYIYISKETNQRYVASQTNQRRQGGERAVLMYRSVRGPIYPDDTTQDSSRSPPYPLPTTTTKAKQKNKQTNKKNKPKQTEKVKEERTGLRLEGQTIRLSPLGNYPGLGFLSLCKRAYDTTYREAQTIK